MSNLSFKTPLDSADNQKLKNIFSKHLSKRLKEVRKNRKFTQQELAEKAGLHLTYIGHLELDKYRPTVFVIWKIARALGVSVDELIDC